MAEERQPWACPLACFLRLCHCGQLEAPVKLPVCVSMAVAGRDVSWYALLVHLQAATAAADSSAQLQADVAIKAKSWQAIRCWQLLPHYRYNCPMPSQHLLCGWQHSPCSLPDKPCTPHTPVLRVTNTCFILFLFVLKNSTVSSSH